MVDAEIDGSIYGTIYPMVYVSKNGAGNNNNPSGKKYWFCGMIIDETWLLHPPINDKQKTRDQNQTQYKWKTHNINANESGW